MASEVLYAEVSPKERVHFTSPTSDTDDPITYAEVNVKWQSDRPDTTPDKTTHTATCSENSHWCYVAVVLFFTSAILLIIVILLAVKCHHS